MNNSDLNSTETDATQTVSPGGLLRSARESRKTSLEEIANALNLPIPTVAALEQDNYDKFPGRTYVRGYLISYARYLMVDHHEVDRAFTSIYPPANSPEENFQRLKADSTFARGERFSWLGLFLLLTAAIAATAYFFWDRLPDSTHTPPPLIAPGEAPTRSSSAEPNSVLSPPSDNEASISLSVPVDQTGPPRRATSAASLPTTRSTTTSAANLGNGSAGEPSAARQPAESPPSQPEKGELLLQFAAESWADIRADDGTKLLYNLQPAGSEISLSVMLPIKVFLGNAPDVKIFYNGALYDQPVRGRISQFTLTAANADN